MPWTAAGAVAVPARSPSPEKPDRGQWPWARSTPSRSHSCLGGQREEGGGPAGVRAARQDRPLTDPGTGAPGSGRRSLGKGGSTWTKELCSLSSHDSRGPSPPRIAAEGGQPRREAISAPRKRKGHPRRILTMTETRPLQPQDKINTQRAARRGI